MPKSASKTEKSLIFWMKLADLEISIDKKSKNFKTPMLLSKML